MRGSLAIDHLLRVLGIAVSVHRGRRGRRVDLAQIVRQEVHVHRAYVERGELVPVLEEFSTPIPGFYLYYPERRQASPALRVLIDYRLELRQAR